MEEVVQPYFFQNKILILIILAFTLRLSYVFTIPPLSIDATDPGEYNSLALSILKGEGLKEKSFLGGIAYSYRPPFYPLFIASIYSIFGNYPLAVRIAQALLSTGVVAILIQLTRNLSGDKTSLWAGLWSCFYPEFIYYSGTLRPTILHTFLLLSAFYLLLHRKTSSYLLSGILLGLSSLTRAITFYLGFAIPLLWMVIYREKKSLIFLVGFLLILSPWGLRNYHIQKELLFTSYEGGYSLWLGHNPLTLKRERGEVALPFCYFPKDGKYLTLSEKEKNDYFKREAYKYIRNNPKEFLLNLLFQLRNFYRPFPDPRYIAPALVLIGAIFNIPLFLSAFYGIFLSRREWRKYLLFYFIILYFTFIYMLFPVVLRYRIPIIPYFILFSSITFATLFKRPHKIQPQ